MTQISHWPPKFYSEKKECTLEMNPEDDINYIVNSDRQITVLRALRDQSSPIPKHELKSETEVSRSTVNRAIDNLSDRNWIEETRRNRYDITTAGESILERYDDFSNTIAGAQTKTRLINQLGNQIEPPSIDVFSEAEAEEYPTTDPMKGWNRATTEASKQVDGGLEVYRGMNPIVSSKGNEIGRKLLATVDEAELIIDEDVLDASKENYTDELDEGLATDNLEIYVSPEKVPITLAIYDEERVELSVHDEQGHPIGGIRGENGELACWAKDLYEEYRAQSYAISELLQQTE